MYTDSFIKGICTYTPKHRRGADMLKVILFQMKWETLWMILWSWTTTKKSGECLSATVIQAHNMVREHFSLPDIFWKKSDKTQESQDKSS